MIETHPIADIWPLMTDSEIDRLAEDIAAHGQVMPIILVEGRILDGRNRWLACERIGVEPWTQEIETDNPDALAWSLNEHRRHASESVRIMAAGRRANLKLGDNQHSPIGGTSQAEAAEQFGVSKRAVERATVVIHHNDPALIAAVESGDLAVSLAAKFVRRVKETGETFTSVADIKKTMRQIFREDHPLPEPSAPSASAAIPPPDHVGVDTFGIVRAIVRHAEQYSPEEAAARIDKWTKLNILDDLPPAIDYLATLAKCLNTEGK
jgi:hypothetical protein